MNHSNRKDPLRKCKVSIPILKIRFENRIYNQLDAKIWFNVCIFNIDSASKLIVSNVAFTSINHLSMVVWLHMFFFLNFEERRNRSCSENNEIWGADCKHREGLFGLRKQTIGEVTFNNDGGPLRPILSFLFCVNKQKSSFGEVTW